MTRVLPLPAPARMSSGPSVLSTASRCCGLSWSKKDKLLCLRFFRPLRRAPFAGTILAQKFPGVDAQFVPVIPAEADGVLAHRLGLQGLDRGLKHRQRSRSQLWRLAWLAATFCPLIVAQGARAGVAQPLEAVAGAVPVLPVNVHARSRGQVHLNRLGISLLLGGHIVSIAQGIGLKEGSNSRDEASNPLGLSSETVILSEGACPSRN